jgi:hypothetical protein
VLDSTRQLMFTQAPSAAQRWTSASVRARAGTSPQAVPVEVLPVEALAEQAPAVESRELPDVTGFLIMLIVTFGLLIVPVGTTLMQGPAILASLFAP